MGCLIKVLFFRKKETFAFNHPQHLIPPHSRCALRRRPNYSLHSTPFSHLHLQTNGAALTQTDRCSLDSSPASFSAPSGFRLKTCPSFVSFFCLGRALAAAFFFFGSSFIPQMFSYKFVKRQFVCFF